MRSIFENIDPKRNGEKIMIDPNIRVHRSTEL